jgi:ABC-type multidrug transport system permease subunit
MTPGGRPRSLPDRPLAQLTLTRFREFAREPEAVFWAVFFPILLAAGLGIAFAGRPAAVLKVAAASPGIAQALRQDPGLDIAELTPDAARAALRAGRVALAAEPGEAGAVVYRYDDTSPDGRAARLLADAAVQRAAGRRDPVAAADAVAREPGSRYIDFLVPGLVGVGIMNNAVWGIGFSIVDARRRKLMKRLMATPMSRAHYLASFLLWRMLLLGVEVGIPIGFGALAFGVPVRGSLAAMLALCVLASLAFSAIGLLVASRAQTIEAVSGLTNLVVMPMWIFSGVFFSAQRFPDLAQPLIRLLPLTAFIDAMRGIALQGAAWWQFPREFLTLAAWLAVPFVLALRLFRWR